MNRVNKSKLSIDRQLEQISDWLNTFEYGSRESTLGLAVHNALQWARGKRVGVRKPIEDLKWRAK